MCSQVNDVSSIFSCLRRRGPQAYLKSESSAKVAERNVGRLKKKPKPRKNKPNDKEITLISRTGIESESKEHEADATTKKQGKSVAVSSRLKQFSHIPNVFGVDDEEFFDVKGEKRNSARRFAEGYAIYTEDEIQNQVSKKKLRVSGTTDLCPFDCDCCF